MSISSDDTATIPNEPTALATWFAEAVRSELETLEKDGGEQRFELLSGKLLEATGQTQAVVHFIVADGTRLPEDGVGRLKTDGEEYTASVIGQQADRIQLQLEGKTPIPPGIPRAMLTIDDTALLRKLAEVLEETAQSADVAPMSVTVFHPERATVGARQLPTVKALNKLLGELRWVLEKACGSSCTYIWGPPGTGKTYAIAHLIAALIELGERVLVTSHTHAAVDQALFAAVKNDSDQPGPLAGHPTIDDGKILRIGRTTDRKIPDSVRLDKVLASKAKELEAEILELERNAKPLTEQRARCRSGIAEWEKVSQIRQRLNEVQKKIGEAQSDMARSEQVVRAAKASLQQGQEELARAQRAWFRREAKSQQARMRIDEAKGQLRKGEEVLKATKEDAEKAHEALRDVERMHAIQKGVCEALPPQNQLAEKLSALSRVLGEIEERIGALQDEISALETKLIADARAIFCTLTKSYMGKQLDEQTFDAVIVDEISMALPPLIFLAAGRSTQRVILVGDFLQLPPIIRSDSTISSDRLRTDIFRLAGIERDMKPVDHCAVLAKLSTQRRMLTQIADVARHLVYTRAGGLEDHPCVNTREKPEWLDFLPDTPLLIVDTADLHCWTGKQPGSLSRFNFYSATVAVELAAMAAAKVSKPADGAPLPIGIVTPFAAQRRLLAKLIKDMNLDQWVFFGTVHTFQGSEAELIVFDCVLDEPYWSARLCTPSSAPEVKRDLNVAVTRARSKFVFIGSSEWLNKHAKSASGLGQMWSFLKDRADLVSAAELVEANFAHHLAHQAKDQQAWRMPHAGDGPAHEILDEANFFDRFAADVTAASRMIFGLVPFFGEYRWPRIQPLFNDALARGVEVTLVTPPLSEVENNRDYVDKAIKNLRDSGAIVISAGGLHGKDVILDEKIHYTGSLNWASHRGRDEIMHRTNSPKLAKLVLQYMQAKYIRRAAVHEDGAPRVCPECGGQTHVVNQRRQYGSWDHQAMKVGCANPDCQRYLRNIDERPPFKEIPRCKVDGCTKYRRVRRGKGEVWQCPKHPKQCPTEKAVPGDPGSLKSQRESAKKRL
ncbi:MAG: AAA domain-containing protein [Gammaproteobacteria bacterium]